MRREDSELALVASVQPHPLYPIYVMYGIIYF